MISEKQRRDLIQYRIEQAIDTIELAQFLLDSKRYNVAVNRIYYGMYYAITALALKYRFETSKHAQLIGWFNKNFVANGKVDKSFGKILRNAFQNRTKGDYDAYVRFEKEEVDLMFQEMNLFITRVEKLLQE